MSPYLGAQVIYRDENGSDFPAVVTRLETSGAVSLTFFPPYQHPSFDTCRGWSHIGSDPENPPPQTWRWSGIHKELGPSGRGFVAEMMTTPHRWHAVLIAFANLTQFYEVYTKQREDAIKAMWPELPGPPPPAPPIGRPDGIVKASGEVIDFKTAGRNGNGNDPGSSGVLQ